MSETERLLKGENAHTHTHTEEEVTDRQTELCHSASLFTFQQPMSHSSVSVPHTRLAYKIIFIFREQQKPPRTHMNNKSP